MWETGAVFTGGVIIVMKTRGACFPLHRKERHRPSVAETPGS